MPGRGHIRQS